MNRKTEPAPTKHLYQRKACWMRDPRERAFCYYATAWVEESVRFSETPRPDIVLSDEAIPLLITALEEAGYIKPRLDERLRVEDLKITHRLMDMLDVLVKQDNSLVISERPSLLDGGRFRPCREEE
jgi:hypothetical protein